MIPQGYPLWIVPDGSGDIWIVIGWREGRHGALHPVVITEGMGEGSQMMTVELGPGGWSVFSDRDDALQVAHLRG